MGIGVRAVEVTDANNQKYRLIANFTKNEIKINKLALKAFSANFAKINC